MSGLRGLAFIGFAVFMFASFNASGQSYSMSSFHQQYDSLVDYTSLSLELIRNESDPFVWEEEFEFGFTFPVAGIGVESITLNSDGAGLIDGSTAVDFNFFSAEYMLNNNQDTSNLFSDIRYAQTVRDDLKTLIVEYHHVYYRHEFYENGPNHFLNFQLWFKEDGTIEMHFGEIQLENCSYYFPGYGFSSDNSSPVENIYGPLMSVVINAELDICVHGSFENLSTSTDVQSAAVLNSIPSSGTVIQLNYHQLASDTDLSKTEFSILRANNTIEILGDVTKIQQIDVYDISGQLIASSENRKIDLSPKQEGIILVIVTGTFGEEVHKVML